MSQSPKKESKGNRPMTTLTANLWKDTLMSSLRQELADLNRLIEELESFFDISALKSWLFPSKTCKEMNETNPDLQDYTNILEYLLDRSYALFNIFLDKLEKFSSAWTKPLVKPKKLSIAAVARVIFDKVDEILGSERGKRVNRKINKNIHPKVLNVESQTEDTNLGVCNSCAYTVECIKTIVFPLEASLETSQIQIARDEVNESNCEITQFGCTKLICDAVVKDIHSLVSKKDHYKSKLADVNSIFNQTIIERELFKKDIAGLKENCKMQANQWLSERNSLRGKVKWLEESNEALTASVRKERGKLENVSAKFLEETQKNNMAKLMIESVKHKNAILHGDNGKLNVTLNLTIAQLLHLIDSLNIKYGALLVKTEMMSKKISAITPQSIRNISTKVKHLRETVDIQMNELQKYKPPLTDNGEDYSSVSGDPLQDMLNQIKLNRLHMRRLDDENSALMKTVNRLRELDDK